MAINVLELQEVLQELSELTSKPNWTKADERRNAFLLAAQAGIKQGVSLQEINRERLGDIERKHNLPVTRFNNNGDELRDARVWSHYLSTGKLPIEFRDTSVGNGKPEYLTGLDGALVPRSFFSTVRAAMKWMDPLVDPDVVTMIETEDGRPLQCGYTDDTSTANYANVITENSNQSANESDLTNPAEIDLGAYSYRTLPYRISIEAFQDLQQMTTAISLFSRFTASRIGLGVGRDLTVGNGVAKTLGLVPSLLACGNCQGAVAAGSSANTGGAETGATSIGSQDVDNLYWAVNEAYRRQPKCAWLASDTTKNYLSKLLNKNGSPIFADLTKERSMLYGKPFLTSPSMASISSASISLVFGDLSAWYTRHATAGDRVTVLRETYAEKGQIGLRSWSRYDGALIYSASVGGTPPIMYLQQHT